MHFQDLLRVPTVSPQVPCISFYWVSGSIFYSDSKMVAELCHCKCEFLLVEQVCLPAGGGQYVQQVLTSPSLLS